MDFQDTLQEFSDIDATLAERLIEHGFDTMEKLAGTRSEDLTDILDLRPKEARSIIAQAKQVLNTEQTNELSLAALIEDATRLKTEVEQLVRNIRKRFKDQDVPKDQLKQLRKETSRTLASLEKLEANLGTQLQRFSLSLARADEKISRLSDRGVTEVVHGLKKARKKIEDATD